MARLMWVFAVIGLITMRSAIWSLDWPAPTGRVGVGASAGTGRGRAIVALVAGLVGTVIGRLTLAGSRPPADRGRQARRRGQRHRPTSAAGGRRARTPGRLGIACDLLGELLLAMTWTSTDSSGNSGGTAMPETASAEPGRAKSSVVQAGAAPMRGHGHEGRTE